MSSDCSSIPDAKFFNDKYTYPSWFTRKKMIFHNKMLRRLKKLRFLHSRASQYYDTMNIRLSAPSIVITALSGIASFLSTSQYVDEDAQNACGITVGVLASAASVFQAFAAACQYGAKKEAHRTVAEQYNALIVKTKFEMEMPNEEDFIDNLEKSILEIDAKCNYFVPQFIIKEWEDKEDKAEKDYKKTHSHGSNSNSLNIGIFDPDNDNDNDNDNNNNMGLDSSQNNINLDISHKNSSSNLNEPNENSYLLDKTTELQSQLEQGLEIKNSINVTRDEIIVNVPTSTTYIGSNQTLTNEIDLTDNKSNNNSANNSSKV